MICSKCGQPISDTASFCPVCGNAMNGNNQENQVGSVQEQPLMQTTSQYPQNVPYQPASQAYPAVQMPLQSKKKFPFVWLIVGVLVLVIAVVGIVFAVRGKGEKSEWQKQLDLGNKYLSELNYEEAIVAFEKVIEIDPLNIEAYRGLAEAYAAMGDYDAAIMILEKGIKRTDAQSLKDYLEELKAEQARLEENRHDSDANGGAETPDDTADQADSKQTGPVFIPWSEAGLEDHVMDWKDANLEAAMREITGITDRDIMLSDVWEITELNLRVRDISDISALGELTNLTELNLWNNNISDISALGNLTNLTYLDLDYSNVIDISALRNLTNLTSLHLSGNNISDISALGSLTNLTYLYLNDNNISDISALGSLTNLTYLYLNDNNISDISALRNLTNLTYLNLAGNDISDISAVGNLTNLMDLELGANNIIDISALRNLTNLTYLDLAYNNVSDISALGSLTNLDALYLYGNPITDYTPVSFMPYVYK